MYQKENKPEYILCSAVWYKELPLKKPEALRLRGYSPYNTDKGIVLCGWRHANCLYQMVAIYGISNNEAGESIQGFLTNLNRFVDRKEAMEIALKSGQIKDKNKLINPRIGLFSEDLY